MSSSISQPSMFPVPGLQSPFGAWSQPLAMPSSAAAAVPQASFAELFSQSLEAVNGHQNRMHADIAGSLTGNDLSMVETFSAAREADLALKLTLQIRNKLIEAYREIQNMQL
ncbi:MAG: flagellar hook-basal body complex protein FliE [Planctomyces sp.]|nr:flagellar hook-basal body complex protein FliE [Planctomyces sp.]